MSNNLIPNRELRELSADSHFTTLQGRRGIVVAQRPSRGITVVAYGDLQGGVDIVEQTGAWESHAVDTHLPVKCGWS